LGYFRARFDKRLGRNFHADLATTLAQSLQRWPSGLQRSGGRCNPGRPVTVTSVLVDSRPTPVDTLQIDFILRLLYGTWTVQRV